MDLPQEVDLQLIPHTGGVTHGRQVFLKSNWVLYELFFCLTRLGRVEMDSLPTWPTYWLVVVVGLVTWEDPMTCPHAADIARPSTSFSPTLSSWQSLPICPSLPVSSLSCSTIDTLNILGVYGPNSFFYIAAPADSSLMVLFIPIQLNLSLLGWTATA